MPITMPAIGPPPKPPWANRPKKTQQIQYRLVDSLNCGECIFGSWLQLHTLAGLSIYFSSKTNIYLPLKCNFWEWNLRSLTVINQRHSALQTMRKINFSYNMDYTLSQGCDIRNFPTSHNLMVTNDCSTDVCRTTLTSTQVALLKHSSQS